MVRGQMRSASPKKVTSMESPAGRLLRLLSLLQMKPTWTAEELADRLAITTRTVRRDVTRLRDLGYPVLAAPGRFGGYQLGPGGALPPLLLSDDEAVAVAIGLRTAASGTVSGIEETSLRALAKLEQVLPSRYWKRSRSRRRQPWATSTNASGSTDGPEPATRGTVAA